MASLLNFAAVFFTLVGISASLNASQEIISSKGVGVSDTKLKACEMALDYARRDAAQSALTHVESSTESKASNSGSSFRSDHVVTTKAFAKLVNKSELISFDERTGMIHCEVSADFKAGFVIHSGKEEQPSASRKFSKIDEHVSGEFRAGEPFCSKIMNACFREIYSEQLGALGIQTLNPVGVMGTKYIFFNEISDKNPEGRKRSEKTTKVETREQFEDFIIDTFNDGGRCDNCSMHLWVKGYVWSSERGFYNPGSSYSGKWMYIRSKPKSGISLLASEPDVSEAEIKKLDKIMAETQIKLDSLF